MVGVPHRMVFGNCCCSCPSRRPSLLDHIRVRWRSPAPEVPEKKNVRTELILIIILPYTIVYTCTVVLLLIILILCVYCLGFYMHYYKLLLYLTHFIHIPVHTK